MTTYTQIKLEANNVTIKKAILEEIMEYQGKNSGGIHQATIERNVAMRLGKKVKNRTLRKSIELLRNEGYLICSDNDNGYHMAASMDEVEEFIGIQYLARIETINKTIKSVRKSAAEKFTGAKQMPL